MLPIKDSVSWFDTKFLHSIVTSNFVLCCELFHIGIIGLNFKHNQFLLLNNLLHQICYPVIKEYHTSLLESPSSPVGCCPRNLPLDKIIWFELPSVLSTTSVRYIALGGGCHHLLSRNPEHSYIIHEKTP